MQFVHVVFEMSEQTDSQTGKHILSHIISVLFYVFINFCIAVSCVYCITVCLAAIWRDNK